MDSDSPDKHEGPTRRQVLKVGALAAVAATAAAFLARLRLGEDTSPVAANPIPPEDSPTLESVVNPELTEFINNHPLLINMTAEQKKQTVLWVASQDEHYHSYNIPANSPKTEELKKERVLYLKKRAEKSQSLTPLINEKAFNLGYVNNSPIAEISPAITFVESGGGLDSDNLFQLEPEVGEVIADDLNINLGKNLENLTNQDVNATIAMEYLARLKRVCFDPSLTVWAFNLGELMMARAIHAYVITTATINEQRADVEKRFASTKEVATAYYAGFYKLNYASFLEDNPAAEAARDSLTRDLKVHGEKFDDVHKHYVSKVLAGDYIMRKANSPRMY